MPNAITDRGIQTRYHYLLSKMQPQSWFSGLFGSIFDSDQSEESYPFLGTAPAMREWIGARAEQTQKEYEYTLKNKKFEASVKIPGELIRRGKKMHVDQYLQQLARRETQHWSKLLTQVLELGESSACWDGQFFFDTDHIGSQSNDITFDATTTTAPTAQEASNAINQAIVQIMGFEDDEGEPMNEDVSEFLVLVPLAFREAFGTALGADFIANGSGAMITNPRIAFSGVSVRLATSARLSWTTKFATFALGDVPPFIFQEESLVSNGLKLVGPGSEYEFDNDAWKAGVMASRNAGYGAWESACLTTFI